MSSISESDCTGKSFLGVYMPEPVIDKEAEVEEIDAALPVEVCAAAPVICGEAVEETPLCREHCEVVEVDATVAIEVGGEACAERPDRAGDEAA